MNHSASPTRFHIPIRFASESSELETEVSQAMAGARSAQSEWARTPWPGRRALLRQLRSLIAEQALVLAACSSASRQRPPAEALAAEVLPLAEACRFLERRAQSILGPQRLGRRARPLWLPGVDVEIHREPFGVILIIGPGNYPLLLPGVQMIQALAAGNAVILKPGAGGSAAAQALKNLMTQAGFDPSLISCLPETVAAARVAIEAHPDKVLFTGSAATGKIILDQLAAKLIPAAMELSGCDAVLVRDDADLELVQKALSFALTFNQGATCLAPKRLYLPARRLAELEARLATAFGRATAPTHILPAASAASSLRPGLVAALQRGARLITGEIREDGALQMPLILGGVEPDSPLLQEERFAAVLSLVTVADDDQATQHINDCPYGLGVSIFSRDQNAARALATRIQVGSVCINDLIVPTADARVPFGGRRRSGFGSTRGAEGLLELTTPKVISVSRSRFRPAFEAPRPADQALFQNYLQLTHGRNPGTRWRALRSLIQLLANRQALPKHHANLT